MANEKDQSEVSQAILKRVHRYVQFGKKPTSDDISWEGVVTLNKQTTICLTNQATQKQEYIRFPGNEEIKCTFAGLQQLVLKATQEGVADKRHDWDAKEGKSLEKNPLKIKIMENGVSPSNPDYYKRLRVPTP